MKSKKIVQLLCLLFTIESYRMYAPPKQSPKGKSASAKDVAKTSAKVKAKQVGDSDDELLDAILSNSEHRQALAAAQSSVTKNYEQELADKFRKLTKLQQDTLLRLIFLISNNQIDEARALINGLKDLTIFNSQDSTGQTILMCACKLGFQDLVEILLKKGANPNLCNMHGWTALMFAAQSDHVEIARSLIDRGADINQKNFSEGATALMIALSNGHIDIARLLINNRGLVVDMQDDTAGWTALIIAAQKGYIDIVRLLINKGANLNKQNFLAGVTALMVASAKNQVAIVELLLDRGAILNAQDNDGRTALIFAAQGGYMQIVKMLFDNGALVNLKNNDGLTALMVASAKNQVAIVGFLLDRGAILNDQDNKGWTALMVAVQKGHIQIVKMLLDNGALVNLKNSYGLTALMIAENKGHTEIARMIQGFLEQQFKKEEEDYRVQILHEEQKALQDLLEQEEEGFANLDPLFKLRRELPKVTNWEGNFLR